MKQVMFYDKANDMLHGGLLTDEGNIICGCCGGIIPADEIGGEDNDTEIIKTYDFWANLDEEICGDDLYGGAPKGVRETCEENIDLWLEENGKTISPELKRQMVDYLADDFDENMTAEDIEIAMNDCIENNKNQ